MEIKKIYKKYEELINYLFFGVLTVVVNFIIKFGLLFTILDASNAFQLQLSIIISWIGAVFFAYVTNKNLVFKNKSTRNLKQIVNFFVARLLTLLIDMFIMWFFVTLLNLNNNIWILFFTLISQIIVIIINYMLSKLFIFKN